MTNLPEEIQDELVAFVRNYANYDVRPSWLDAKAKDLLAKLPPAVDPDIEEARKLARPWLIYDDPSALTEDYPAIRALLAAIKRGRELERASQ